MLQDTQQAKLSSALWLTIGSWGSVVAAFVAVGILLAILAPEAPLSVRIHGPQLLGLGQHASFRISVFDPDQYGLLSPITAELWLHNKQQKHRLFQGKTSGTILLANIQTPPWPAGHHYQLQTIVRYPTGQKIITRNISLLPISQITPIYTPITQKISWELYPTLPNTPYRVLMFAENRAPVADLPTPFWLHIQQQIPTPTTAATRPTSADGSAGLPTSSWRIPDQPLQVRVQHDPPDRDPLTTDTLGLLSFSDVPQFFQERRIVSVRDNQREYTFHTSLKPEGYQLVLHLPQATHPPGRPLLIRVDGLLDNTDIHLDITQHGHILWSHQGRITGGRAILSLPIPPQIQGLITIQVYSEPSFPGEVHDERLVFLGQPTRHTLFAALQQHLLQRGDTARLAVLETWQHLIPATSPPSAWAKPLLALCKARFVRPTLYHDSTPDRLRNLRNHQKQFRFATTLMLGGLGGCILLVFLVWITLDQPTNKQHQLDLPNTNSPDHPHKQKPLRFSLFFVILAAFFTAVILLFWVMQWAYDAI